MDWAFRWLWSQPEVSVVLSGMSSMAETEKDVALACDPAGGTLTRDELSLYDKVRAAYKRLMVIPCSGCGYCMPCP
jgi:hypothetical protein